MENVDSNVILLDCLNISCSALILILKSLSVEMIEDFVLFKICPLELTSFGTRCTFHPLSSRSKDMMFLGSPLTMDCQVTDSIPHICHFFYKTVISGVEILHLKVRKFVTKV